MEKLNSIPRSAEILGGISHWTVRAWIGAGKLHPTRVGGRVMLAESELERFLADEQARPRSKTVSARSGKAKPKQAAGV